MTVEGVVFPDPTQWITHPERLDEVGEALLAVTHGALELYGYGERYERKFVSHGQAAVMEPAAKANQLVIVCSGLQMGRPGEEQFQLIKGALGQAAFQTAAYLVELATPWPMRQGTQAVSTVDVDEWRKVLWRDALIGWEAMVALMLGAVTVPGITRQNEIALGPLTPKDPKGGVASWVWEVQMLM